MLHYIKIVVTLSLINKGEINKIPSINKQPKSYNSPKTLIYKANKTSDVTLCKEDPPHCGQTTEFQGLFALSP